MDDPTNLMVVTGVLVLDEPVPLERVEELLRRRLLRFPRFSERVVHPLAGVGTPSWETDPDFSLARHLLVAELPASGDEAALQALVGGLMSQPLPPDRPLWQFHLVPRFQGGSALVTRIHHCVGDGLALVHVLLSMADGMPEPPPPPEGDGLPSAPVGSVFSRTATWALEVPRRVADGASEVLGRPGALVDGALRLASGASSLAHLLALPPDPPTPLKGRLSVEKRVAWSRPFPLDDFKSAGKLTGSTVNDILVASLAGALRRYLLGRGPVPPDLDVRGVVPVNLRPVEESHLLGNQFGMVFLSLPLGIADPLERLFEVRRRMRALKGTPEAWVIYGILWAMGAAPKPLFDLVLNLFGSKATAVVTNVIGPREPIAIAGTRLRQAMFWVPSSGRLAMGVSLLSYAGSVWLSVQTDAGLLPDPERILAGFEAEVEALRELRGEAAGE
jgi:WS/DGAT/MGAT family acyltransferase